MTDRNAKEGTETKRPEFAAPQVKNLGAVPTRKRRKDVTNTVQTRQLLHREPVELAGQTWPLTGEVSIGRAAGCQVTIDDTYASQIHARLFTRDNQWQIEDLGSTNGKWLNRHKVSGPMVIKPGDVVQIGNTVMEMQ